MGLEIERKFLVIGDNWKSLAKGILYRQGYLNLDKSRTVRVRIIDQKGILTVKGKSIGASRLEYEYDIPLSDAQEMLDQLCEKPIIEKYRYTIPFQGFFWEVDEFLGDNKGLIVAEIELKAENEVFKKPDWIGQEVTGEVEYYNSSLSQKPFKTWS